MKGCGRAPAGSIDDNPAASMPYMPEARCLNHRQNVNSMSVNVAARTFFAPYDDARPWLFIAGLTIATASTVIIIPALACHRWYLLSLLVLYCHQPDLNRCSLTPCRPHGLCLRGILSLAQTNRPSDPHRPKGAQLAWGKKG